MSTKLKSEEPSACSLNLTMAKRSKPRRRSRSSLQRRVGYRRPKYTFLVFCEGRTTEPDYLRSLKREPAVREIAAVDIRIENGNGVVPLTLVKRAVDARVRNPRDQGAVDDVWCLFDVEWPKNHPNLQEAIDRAESNDVHLAISNPCFELWLALHFDDHAAWLDNEAAGKLRRKHDRSTGKGLDGTLYMPRRAAAAARALALAAKHEGDGTLFPHDNPSSGMYRFLEAIEPNK